MNYCAPIYQPTAVTINSCSYIAGNDHQFIMGHVEFCVLPLRACVPLRASICICVCVHMHAFDQMRFAFPSVTSFASVT